MSSKTLYPSSTGLRTEKTAIPHFLAAETFSKKPPFRPDSFVTSASAPVSLNMASFISSENGPCMAMMFFDGTPRPRHALMESTEGRTRK